MATRKPAPMTTTERRLSFADDCEYQASVDERLAVWFAAQGNAYQAQRARARAARWRANAAAWRQGRAAA